MFSRMLFVRLKSAENALRDGRLDDAYRLATAPDIHEHRRGSAVLAALTEKFIERARNHFREDRFTEAQIDLDRAETGGVMKEQIAELRGHIRTVAAEAQRRDQSRRDRLETAKRHIEGGSLVAGRRILEQASENDPAAQELRRKAEHRAEDIQRVVEQVETFIAQGQFAAAAQRLRRAKGIDAHDQRVTRVEARLCDQVLSAARSAIVDGRLTRAADELRCLGDSGRTLPARRELNEQLSIGAEAIRCLQEHRYADSRRHALSLGRLLPEAKWWKEAAEQLRQLDEIRTALCSGPLGDRMDADNRKAVRFPVGGSGSVDADERLGGRKPAAQKGMGDGKGLDDTVALPGRIGGAGALPEKLLLLVDGGGSYLIHRGGRVTIGRAASSDPADVALYSDVAERHANVTRVEDDYFLFSDKEVEISGAKTKHQLLRDGDRIVFGRRAKLTFRLPSRKSPSAVLELSDTTKMPHDVRRVVLFNRHATIGAGPAAHMGCQHAGPPLVLFERDGTLWLRQKSDGHVDTESVELRLGEPVEIAGASLVLQPWDARTPGARAI